MWFKKWRDQIAKRLGYVPVSPDTVSSSKTILVQLASVRALSCKACSGQSRSDTSTAIRKLDNATDSLLAVMKDNWPDAYRAFMLRKQLNA